MNERVLKTLEYNKILDILSGYAGSEPAKNMCLKLRPSGNPEWIIKAQDETEAAFNRLLKDDRLSFGANKDIRGMIKSAAIGHTLSASELLSISRLLVLTNDLSAYGNKDDETVDALSDYFLRLMPLPLLEKEIGRCITPDEEIADNASPALSSIRKNYQIIGGRIHSQLNNMVNSTYRSYLQDAVITMRGNRYCLPVKATSPLQVQPSL